MQLINKFYKRFRFFFCVIVVYSHYACVIALKNKKGITIINAFQKNLDKSNYKSDKVWIDKDSEFHKRSMESFLKKNDIEMYSTCKKGKSVVAERLIRTLKTKFINIWLQF